MGDRGSKSIIRKYIVVKEQRVDGSLVTYNYTILRALWFI